MRLTVRSYGQGHSETTQFQVLHNYKQRLIGSTNEKFGFAMTQWFDLTPIIAYSQWELLTVGLIGLACGFLSAYYAIRPLISNSYNHSSNSTNNANDADESKSL